MLTAIKRPRHRTFTSSRTKKGQRGIRYRIDGHAARPAQAASGNSRGDRSAESKFIGKNGHRRKSVLPQEGSRFDWSREGSRTSICGRQLGCPRCSARSWLSEFSTSKILQVADGRFGIFAPPKRSRQFKARGLTQPHGLALVPRAHRKGGKKNDLRLYFPRSIFCARPKLNIITSEDPVEYQLDSDQSDPKFTESIGHEFSPRKRCESIFAVQDPDIIMVGEISRLKRDRGAWPWPSRASRGISCLATLHTNDCGPVAVNRLLDMNIEPYLLSSALNGVVAQRIGAKRSVRRARQKILSIRIKCWLDAGFEGQSRPAVSEKGQGCQQCHDTGYRGPN